MVKTPPANTGHTVRPLGGEDPLEKRMATHWYSCLGSSKDRGDWGDYNTQSGKELDTTKRLSTATTGIQRQV